MNRRRATRIAICFLVVVAAAALIPQIFLVAMRAKFGPEPAAVSLTKPHDALEAQHQDIARFAQLIALDRSFSDKAREEAERQIAGMLAAQMPLDAGHFRVALMRIAALADNGHTLVPWWEGKMAPVLPIRVTLFSDGLYVMRTKTADSDLLGARVTAIDGHLTAEILAGLEKLQGGRDGWQRTNALMFITSPEILYGADLTPAQDRSTWTFLTPRGDVVEKTMHAETVDAKTPFGWTTRWMASPTAAVKALGWQGVVNDDASLPESLRDYAHFFHRYRFGCSMAVQLKGIGDVGEQKIDSFLRDTEADLRAHPPCAFILDVRFNTGGDYTKSYAFAHMLPSLLSPDARVYVLTSGQTFSAAITTIGFIKSAMSSRVMILGEPIGDRLAFWAEGGSGCLPNSNICVDYATGLHDYAHPCRDIDKCFWLNWFYPVHVDTLEPAETISMSFTDYTSGRDPAFERAVALATGAR